MLESKKRGERSGVWVMMESSRRANPALEDPVRSRNRVLEVGISAAQASFAKGALQRQRAVEEGVALATAVMWIWQNGPRPPSRTACTAAPGPWPDRRGCRG